MRTAGPSHDRAKDFFCTTHLDQLFFCQLFFSEVCSVSTNSAVAGRADLICRSTHSIKSFYCVWGAASGYVQARIPGLAKNMGVAATIN